MRTALRLVLSVKLGRYIILWSIANSKVIFDELIPQMLFMKHRCKGTKKK